MYPFFLDDRIWSFLEGRIRIRVKSTRICDHALIYPDKTSNFDFYIERKLRGILLGRIRIRVFFRGSRSICLLQYNIKRLFSFICFWFIFKNHNYKYNIIYCMVKIGDSVSFHYFHYYLFNLL